MRAASRSTDAMKLNRWLPNVERLEARETPAVTASLSQVANWAELGPNVINNGQLLGINSTNPNGGAATNATIGAISAVAPHPTNPNIMFVGAPNGGVWRTNNAQDASPTWTPLTDNLASLSITDINFDLLNHNRVVVGIGAAADGSEASTTPVRGDLVGLLVSDNALDASPTWRIVGGQLAGREVVKVAIRGVVWTVATTSGVFRSTDSGATFTNVFLSSIDNGLTRQPRPFTGRVYDMAQNPRLLNQYYLATDNFLGLGKQVWRSDDFGETWGTVTDPQMQLSANTTSVRISVRDTAANDNQVYVAVVNTLPNTTAQRQLPGVSVPFAWANRNNVLSSICWSTNQGGNWTRMDNPRQMTAPEGLDLGQRRDGDPFQGGGLRADNGRVLVVTDEVRNGTQFGDGFPHRLQTGDRVYIQNITEFPPATPPPTDQIFDRGQGAFYDIEVRDEYSFWLLNVAAPSALMDSRTVFYQRVVDATPGEAGFLDIVAAPSNTAVPNASQELVYIGGDFAQYRFTAAGTPVAGGIDAPFPTTFTNSVWQGNRFTVPNGKNFTANQWANLTDDGAANTSPGGDTREMVFDASGNLWLATGTGIYRRSTNTGQAWTNASNNIRVGQFWGVGFDTRNNLAVGATQDTGMVEQTPAGGQGFQSVLTAAQTIGRGPGIANFTGDVRNFYTDQQYAYEVAVDNTSDPTRSIRYFASSSFGQLNQNSDASSFIPGVIRRVYDTAGNLLSTSALRFANALTTTSPLSGINAADVSLSRVTNGRMDTSARVVMELNANDATRAAYGMSRVYEDSDPLGPGSSPETGFVVSDVTPGGLTGRVRAMSYGGKRAGINFNQVMFVGTTTGQLWIRGEFGPTFNQRAPGAGEVTDIQLDPDDYRHAFVAQGGSVFETRDLGATWTPVSTSLVTPPDPLTGLPSNNGLTTQIYAIALFDPNPGTANVGTAGDVVLLAGGRGGVFRRTITVCGTGTVWSEYGNGLPNSVVTDIEVVGNRLVAGTFGRGVWTVPDVAPTLTANLLLSITSDAAGDSIVIAPDPLDPNAINVIANGTNIGRFSFGQFDTVVVTGNGGNDTVQIGNLSSGKFVNYPIGVHLGGDAGDTLIVEANGSTADIQATIAPTTIGSTAGDTIFSGCGSLTYSGVGANGRVELRTGSGNDRVILATGAYAYPIVTNTGGGNDLVFLTGSSVANVSAIDGAGNDDTLQISVPAGLTVTGSPSNVFSIGTLNVGTNGGFENLIFTGEGTGAAINAFGSGLDDDFFLMADPVLAPNGFSQLIVNTPGVPSQRIRFFNMNTVTVNGLAGTDRLIVDSNALGAGGSTDFVNYLVNAGMGGDANDAIILDDSSSTLPAYTTVSGNSVGAGANDSLFGVNGRLFFGGINAGRLFLTTGLGSDLTVFDTSLPLNVTLNGGGGSDVAFFSGTGGNDVTYVGGTTVVANAVIASTTNVSRFQFGGNGGTDTMFVGGTVGDDNLGIFQSGLKSGAVGGVAIPVDYFDLETLNLVPHGGTNNLSWVDVSNSVIGSPTNPGAGIDFIPTGAASGQIRMASGAGTVASFNGVNGSFVMNGDPFSTNTGDVLTVFGTSTTGLAAFGELTSPDGTDAITATGDGVIISNVALGQLRTVAFGATTGGRIGFANVWVRGGNEAGTGDTFVSFPTNRTNLLLEGGNPTATPGDTLLVTTNGPASSGAVNDPTLGPPHTRITNRGDRASLGHLNFETVNVTTTDPTNPGSPPVPSFGSSKSDLFVAASNGLSVLNVYNLDGSLRYPLVPYPGYNGRINVAVGDVTGDGKSDIVTAPWSGTGPLVKVFNGQTGALHYEFAAYDVSFTGGVTVAVGNLNSDQYADIVTGVGPGSTPHVRVFDGASAANISNLLAFGGGFTGGVNVATGDLNGDGVAEIITGVGSGGSSFVAAYDASTNAQVRAFSAYGDFTGGVSVAAGDITGDGLADIITGAGPGATSHVKVFDGASSGEIRSFIVNDPNVPGTPPISITGGVNVAASDIDGDGLVDVLTGRGPGFRPFAQYFKVSTRFGGTVLASQGTLLAIDTFGDQYSNGITVGA